MLSDGIGDTIDNCPPEDAIRYDGHIFIFVRNNPPILKSFRTNFERNRLPNADLCLRKAISCGLSLNYLKSIQNLFPISQGWHQASGKIKNIDGMLKQTSVNLTHYSFWIEENIKHTIHEKFEVLK